jgi:cyclase
MVIKRLIPCLLFDGKYLVKTVNFKNPKYIGDPINAIKIFNDKEVDELIFLDIKATVQNRPPAIDIISQFTSECFMPFGYGGGIKSYADCQSLFKAGVEKIIVNSLLLENPDVVKRVVTDYGSQAVVASIDVKKNLLGQYIPYSYSGKKIKYSISEYINYIQNDLNVGELMLTSVNKEGTWDGYDFDLYKKIQSLVKVPLIASGGAGSADDLKKVLYDSNCDAAAVGSMAVYQRKGMGVLINFPKRESVIKE